MAGSDLVSSDLVSSDLAGSDLTGSAPSAGAICQPAVGGGGLRTEAAVLNNPAAGCMPTAGEAPSYGPCSTGRSRHAIPGLALPFAVILTAHRLHSPLRPARQTAWTLAWNSKAAIHALKTNCRSKRSSRCFDREIRISRNRLGSIIDTSQALVGWR